ncbi:MAG: ArsR family transcriptional regulator [Caldilineaceae bacterium]|nr:ArsR family transcriptional regulator [Caldilineaceae bacterium]
MTQPERTFFSFGAGVVPPPQAVAVTVALEPVYNILVSMAALSSVDEIDGLSEWAMRTAEALPDALASQNRLVFWGIGVEALANAVPYGPATEHFPGYLDALAARDPVALRDELLYWLLHSTAWRTLLDSVLLPEPEISAVLADPTIGIRFLEGRADDKFDHQLAATVFDLFRNPIALQRMLVAHLTQLWETTVEREWNRVRPLLQASVDAFEGVSLTGLTILEAIEAVTGRDLRTLFRLDALLRYRRIRFMPTLHNGPYIVWFGDDKELRMTFLARRPQRGVSAAREPLSALELGELAGRLAALADETRLAMLFALFEQGELSTQAIIDRFGLNKSAASRHLRLLYANNLLRERREDGAKKVYTLNQRTVGEVLRLLGRLASDGG